METSLNLHCPACGAAIVPRLGFHGCCLMRAIQLQAARFGTELFCGRCGGLHLVLRTDASRGPSSENGNLRRQIVGDDWQVESFGEPEELPS